MALRNLPQEALSSENVELLAEADDSLRLKQHPMLMHSFFAVASSGKF
jgi:hypothetical protein